MKKENKIVIITIILLYVLAFISFVGIIFMIFLVHNIPVMLWLGCIIIFLNGIKWTTNNLDEIEEEFFK